MFGTKLDWLTSTYLRVCALNASEICCLCKIVPNRQQKNEEINGVHIGVDANNLLMRWQTGSILAMQKKTG